MQMDPKATFELFLNALVNRRADDAREHAEDLICWLAAGGFEPSHPKWGKDTGQWNPRAVYSFIQAHFHGDYR